MTKKELHWSPLEGGLDSGCRTLDVGCKVKYKGEDASRATDPLFSLRPRTRKVL